MGFFSDLKEDLSQAVNELMPEEESLTTGTQEEDTADEIKEVSQEELDAMLADLERKEEEKPVREEAPVKPVREESARSSFTPAASSFTPAASSFAPAAGSRMAADETAIITQGMVINGDIISEGSIELTGSINGNITALGKLNISGTIVGNSKAAEIYAEGAKITGEVVSEGTAKIGQSTVIIGNITATSAVIAGAIKGDIDVRGPVILDSSAIVMGNIKSKSVQINNGAVIEGMCSQTYADVSPTSFFNEIKKASKQ